jgi:hypothetical protein
MTVIRGPPHLSCTACPACLPACLPAPQFDEFQTATVEPRDPQCNNLYDV